MKRYTIRASSIGHPCIRKVWLSTFKEPEEFTPQTLLTFDIGTALEEVAIKYIQMDGWETDYNPGSQEAEDKVSIEILKTPEYEVYLEGHPDAVIWRPQKPEEKIMVDIKTMNDFAFKDWKKHGTLKKYPQYAEQVHIYGYGKGIFKLGIAALNKNKAEFPIPIDTFTFDPEIWENIMRKCNQLAEYAELPFPPAIDDEIPSWCCGYCGYKRMGLCEGA